MNHRVRKVTAAGIISTVAGNGAAGFTGDNGPAVSAQLNSPNGVAADAAGNLFVADTINNRIREVNQAGIITTIVGNGSADFKGDGGPADAALLSFPTGLAVDVAGNLLVADTGNHRIRKVTFRQQTVFTMATSGGISLSSSGTSGNSAVAMQWRNPTPAVEDCPV